MIDLTDRVVNKLRVLRRVENVGRQPAWLCLCECGTEKRFLGMHLRLETPADCGCGLPQRMRAAQVTHGMTYSPEWRSWNSMVQRCTCETHASWKDYGGRGIKVCKRWLTFENFYKDMGLRPPGTSLDRKNNSRGYSPANCRWATHEEQQNNRRSNVYLTLDGQTKTMKQWATHFGVKYSVVKERHADGKTGMDLFATSPRKQYGRAVEFSGEAKTITQWAKHYCVTYQEMWKRINLWNQHPNGDPA